jgi:hypothetical protein
MTAYDIFGAIAVSACAVLIVVAVIGKLRGKSKKGK